MSKSTISKSGSNVLLKCCESDVDGSWRVRKPIAEFRLTPRRLIAGTTNFTIK
jgi:hypothetical protein